jgi:hypothetical protein
VLGELLGVEGKRVALKNQATAPNQQTKTFDSPAETTPGVPLQAVDLVLATEDAFFFE